ncbi:hypothetical protein [Microbacterium allomyrinae]|uniref:HNH endonuclease n=1 Tax=Microbacterium allomyrinae TaxID=2830666 RepID=A0A9X1S4K4_9MICO|nr:hypothetical protein [Microbacterium allomyrinae]MCC2033090.1 hypothetical protein [Microbacterium allomyrinae]
MSAPTDLIRQAVYRRDQGRCVACNASDLTFQHRRAVGMGGSKIRPGATDGLALCMTCNRECEASMQQLALSYGWKAKRWTDPTKVPVYYPHEFQWFRLEGTDRYPIPAAAALDMMHAVYGDEYFNWRDN